MHKKQQKKKTSKVLRTIQFPKYIWIFFFQQRPTFEYLKLKKKKNVFDAHKKKKNRNGQTLNFKPRQRNYVVTEMY